MRLLLTLWRFVMHRPSTALFFDSLLEQKRLAWGTGDADTERRRKTFA